MEGLTDYSGPLPHVRLVETQPAVSVIRDRGGARAVALGLKVTWTACHYGGRRPWLVCPSCGRRRVALYQARQGPEYACRACLGLYYWTQRLGWYGRRAWALWWLREQLGGARFPRRPRRMWHRTYLRLRERARRLERELRAADMVRAERLERAAVARLLRRIGRRGRALVLSCAPSAAGPARPRQGSRSRESV